MSIAHRVGTAFITYHDAPEHQSLLRVKNAPLDKALILIYADVMSIESLLEIAKETAKEAGFEVLKLYGSRDFETKKDGSPVTIADKKAHDVIMQHLEQTGILVLSEESKGVPLPYPERMWIIDPIDGTRGFIDKTGDFAIMIGLIERGQPVLGVVYAPAQNTLYYASKGSGAYTETPSGTVVLKTKPSTNHQLRFVCSKNHFTDYMTTVSTLLQADAVPMGGVGIKAVLLAEDKGDFFFNWGPLGEWDVCAPQIILEEAGGIVSDCLGNPLTYGTQDHIIKRGMIFSRNECFNEVRDAVKKVFIQEHKDA